MADSTNAAATDPATAPPAEADATKRQRAQVDALLARAPVRHTASVVLADGRALDYAVHAAFMPVAAGGLGADSDEPQAAVFTMAYTATSPAGGAPRPVCFAFNGGPGSASVWLHLGALGPKRVPVADDGSLPPPPYAVADNPLTWLAHFDLVFIDPPHTGWSISAGEAARQKHLSVDGDVAVLAETVRAWLAAHGRFGAPLYLAGESYGTTRGAALANQLLDMGLALAGVVLVSCAMDLQSIVFSPKNDLPYSLFLPGYAVTAQYHGLLKGRLAASPDEARRAAEAFIESDYLAALQAGARLGQDARRRTEKRLAELTGLPLAVVAAHNLRISDQTFFMEALRPRGRMVGRLESRSSAPLGATQERQMLFDPGIEAVAAPYTTAALAYFAELGLPVARRYEVLSREVNRRWRWQRGAGEGMRDANGFASTSDDLARALRRNPHLRVLVASGRYDLGTPYSATDWSLAQLDAPADVLQRVTHRYYDAGHMMYTRQADLAQLSADLAAWLADGRAPAGAAPPA